MKKILAITLSVGMLLSLCACSGDKNNVEIDVNVQREKEQIDDNVQTEVEDKSETETENEIKKITKEEYEKMTADDLFNAIVKDPENITLDEYIAVVETLQYADITDSLDFKNNITDDVLEKLRSDYWCEALYPRNWVPLLITHEAPQVRGKAFGNAYYLYGESPEFLTAAKEVMKTETEPFVIYNIIRQLPVSLVASDPELAEFVQKNTNNEHTLVQKIATSTMEKVAKENQ